MAFRPLLPRGEFSVSFLDVSATNVQRLLKIPGVTKDQHGVRATHDAAPIVAKALGRTYNPVRDASYLYKVSDFPGAKSFRKIFIDGENPAKKKSRAYQKAASVWMAPRNAAINADPMRVGKSIEVLGALALRDVARTLVICPAGVRLGWAEEITSFYGPRKAVLLYGRAANKIRVYGDRRFIYAEKDPDRFRATLANARFVIINYELLIGQSKTNDRGGNEGLDERLKGWNETLAQLAFEAAVLDEGSVLATPPKWNDAPNKIRASTARVVGESSIPIVYEAEGTPCRGGKLRSYWGQLDILSGGTWGRTYKGDRLPFTFDARYADGHMEMLEYGRDEHGAPKQRRVWKADGISEDHVEEFLDRLDFWMIQRTREFLLPFMPPKTRQMRWVETEGPLRVDVSDPRHKSAQSKWLATTLPLKIAAMKEEVVAELEQGAKMFIFTQRKASAHAVHNFFSKLVSGVRTGGNLRAMRTAVWLCTGAGGDGDDESDARGLSPEQRHHLAKRFRQHDGAALVVATISSLRGGYHFPSEVADHPVTVVHRIERHANPDWMLQSEDRAYAPGITRGLVVCDWAVQGTPDEYEIRKILPKIEALDRLQQDGTAKGMAQAMRREDPETHWRSIIDAMLADQKKRKGLLDDL